MVATVCVAMTATTATPRMPSRAGRYSNETADAWRVLALIAPPQSPPKNAPPTPFPPPRVFFRWSRASRQAPSRRRHRSSSTAPRASEQQARAAFDHSRESGPWLGAARDPRHRLHRPSGRRHRRGSRGVGRGITEAFLAAGADVAICGRQEPAVDELPSSGGRRAWFLTADVRDAEQAASVVSATAQHFGRVDVLINNAGGSPAVLAVGRVTALCVAGRRPQPPGPAVLRAGGLCGDASGRHGGSIVNIGSVSGLRPSPGTAAYGAAKAGLISLTRSLADRVGTQDPGQLRGGGHDRHRGGPGPLRGGRGSWPRWPPLFPLVGWGHRRTWPMRACSWRRRWRPTCRAQRSRSTAAANGPHS